MHSRNAVEHRLPYSTCIALRLRVPLRYIIVISSYFIITTKHYYYLLLLLLLHHGLPFFLETLQKPMHALVADTVLPGRTEQGFQ